MTNRGIASLLERKEGFRVAGQAGSLAEAKRFVEGAASLPSLVILDIQLGEKNGLDFLAFLKDFCLTKKLPPPPVLICSAFDDPFRMEAALKMGAMGYLPKNGNPEEMHGAVNAVLRGEVYVPAQHASRLRAVSGKYAQLSKRELEVAALVRQGKTSQQIADAMCISKRTVETHINNIYQKTGAANRAELKQF